MLSKNPIRQISNSSTKRSKKYSTPAPPQPSRQFPAPSPTEQHSRKMLNYHHTPACSPDS